jgi:hypothetical protein
MTQKVITLGAIGMLLLGTLSVTTAQAKEVSWRTIVGIVEAANVVGTSPGIVGGAPWSTLGGGAQVDLGTGKVQFQVKGLVLAAGAAEAFGLTGLPIGTPDGVTDVEGTLVCDLDDSAGSGTATVDTPSVPLSSTGDAQFSGSFAAPLPPACTNEQDIAFLIRIFNPPAFRGVWIANGAVLNR